MATTINPLRHLREQFDTNRANFARRYRIPYGTICQAELGMIERPIRFIATLAQLSGRKAKELHEAYDFWRFDNAEI